MSKKLGFGFMRLPEINKSIDTATVCKMVDTFLERGFTYFDTAYMYHNFKSETTLYDTLIKRHKRNSFTVATKMPTMMLKDKDDLERIFNEQLNKCGVDYFDYYLVHSLNAELYKTAEKTDAFGFIEKKKAEGKIKHTGFSFHDNAVLLDKILKDHPEVEFVQLQLNYLDWDSDTVQSHKCYDVAVTHNKRVFVMEPVKGGTLAKVPPTVENLFSSLHPDWSPSSWAIRYAASLDHVDIVLSGMSDMSQLLDNTSYMQNPLPLREDELRAVSLAADIITNSTVIPCTACRYCVDGCPKKIPIPDYFSLYNNVKKQGEKDFYTETVNYASLAENMGKASDCVGCKQCESICPQHLKICEQLSAVAKAFEN